MFLYINCSDSNDQYDNSGVLLQPIKNKKLQKAQAKVDELKEEIQENIKKALITRENLEHLQGKALELQKKANLFNKQAKIVSSIYIYSIDFYIF